MRSPARKSSGSYGARSKRDALSRRGTAAGTPLTEVPCRPGTAAAAAVVIAAAIALALRGIARTAVATTRTGPAAPLLGPRLRAWYRALLEPLEELLVHARVPPDILTFAQLMVSVLAGVAFAHGGLFLAGWLTILAGTLDIMDGGLARRAEVAGARGALLDSVVDRCAEFATFTGLAVYFRESWMLVAVVSAAMGSFLVSYVRARAEALGLEVTLGRAQRPERYVLLGFGAFVAGLVGHLVCVDGNTGGPFVLEGAVVLLAGASCWTAFERTWHALHALGKSGSP